MPSRLHFEMTEPEVGHRFGNGEIIVARGTAFIEDTGLPTLVITGVDVQFGAGAPFTRADLDDNGDWQTVGTANTLDAVAEVTARCKLHVVNDGETARFRTVQVVVGQLVPRVDIDPFDTDVTVTEVPYHIPLVSGRATEPFTQIGTVRWQIGNEPLSPVDSVIDGRWQVANIPVPAGRHPLTFVATDPFNSSGSSTVDMLVRVPIDPGERDRVFAQTSYLNELLGLAQRYITVDGAPPGPSRADLEARLHQPLDGLTRAAAFRAATADVSQTRVAVEVLRGIIPPSTTVDIDQRHRELAYEALIRALGTSVEELRLARTADQPQRVALAERLGLDLEPTRPDQLDRISIAAVDLTDDNLAQIFGYQPPVPVPLEGTPPGTAGLLLAQQAALRRAWRSTDERERDNPSAPKPLILPDLLTDADFVSADPGSPARLLWTNRTAAQSELRTEIRAALAGSNRTQAGFDAAVARYVGPINLPDLAARDRTGEDVATALAAVGLDKPALRRLDRLRSLIPAGQLGGEEWDEIATLLLAVTARQQYGQWRREEVERGIVLDPAVFTVRTDAAATPTGWRPALAARSAQFTQLTHALPAAVAQAEQAVLPQLRDALIAAIGARQPVPESFDAAAERLSRALSFDLRVHRDRRTTRVGQAVESLQELFTTARSGSYRPDLGVPVLRITGEDNFDLEWLWLLTYDRWLAAMRGFAYPENQLQPQLYIAENAGSGLVLEPTQAYTDFIKALSALASPTPDQVRTLARNYLDALPGDVRPDGVTLTEHLTNAELAARQGLCITLVERAQGPTPFTAEEQIPQHIREIFWLVPVAAARKLHAAAQYVAALDWFRTVFAYHLPPDRRLIYYGLALEQNTTSDYGRLPEWLAQVKELNPHFTARKRRGAYTRATALAQVQCLLDSADAEFVKSTTDSRARAIALYQTAHDVLLLEEVIPEQGQTVPFPLNPVWQSLSTLADVGLAKVHAGFDVGGQPDPSRTNGANALPSPFRYSVLVERAKTLVGIAQQVETAYLSALERRDGENYALLLAGRDLQVAAGQLVAQDLRVEVAATGVAQAGLQRDRAQLQFDTYDGWLSGGLNDAERTAMDALRLAEGLHAAAGLAQLAGSLDWWDAGGNLAGALSEAASAVSTEAQIQQTRASYERRAEEWELHRDLAAKDQQFAESQITGAQLQQQVAVQERQVASDQLAHAHAVAEFLATKFTNAELYDWMSGVLGRVYAFFLQRATALAKLAQAQLAFERQEVVSGFIAADYWQPAPAQNVGTTNRRGITGSARLLEDVFQLDQHAFDTDRRKLHLTQTISVSQLAAFELEQFRQTGVLVFATPETLFDSEYPGHYLRLIKRVSVSLIALLPVPRGLRATLSASGISRAVVRRDSFQSVVLLREPESIAFTTPINASGLFQLEQEGAMLLPFEGMGVDTVWRLDLPKAANPFDYRSIADMMLTIEYTALDNAEYREQVIRSLDRRFSGDRSFSIRNDFPDVWYDLNNPDKVEDPARRMRAVLSVTATDLPPHIADLTVAHLTLFAVRDDALVNELTVTALRHTGAAGTIETGEVRTVGGIVTTRRSSGAPWQVFAGDDPAGSWEIQLEDTDAVRSWFTGELIHDIVLVLTLSGTTPAWS